MELVKCSKCGNRVDYPREAHPVFSDATETIYICCFCMGHDPNGKCAMKRLAGDDAVIDKLERYL